MATIVAVLQPEIEVRLFGELVLSLLLEDKAEVKIITEKSVVIVSGEVGFCPLLSEDRSEIADMAEYLVEKTGIDEPAPDWFENPSGFDLLKLFLRDDKVSLLFHYEEVIAGEYDYLLLFNSGEGQDYSVHRESGATQEKVAEILTLMKSLFSN